MMLSGSPLTNNVRWISEKRRANLNHLALLVANDNVPTPPNLVLSSYGDNVWDGFALMTGIRSDSYPRGQHLDAEGRLTNVGVAGKGTIVSRNTFTQSIEHEQRLPRSQAAG